MQNCITRRLGFSPTQKAIRIEGSCDRLRLLGSCKNFKGERRDPVPPAGRPEFSPGREEHYGNGTLEAS